MGDSATRGVIALTELVQQHYNQCGEATGSFGNLHLDLLSLRQELQTVELLPLTRDDLDAIYSGCEGILCDIGRLLSKYDSYIPTKKELWKKFNWYSADIAQLKSRVATQVRILRQLADTMNSPVQRRLGSHAQDCDLSISFSRPAESTSGGDEPVQSNIPQELQDHGDPERPTPTDSDTESPLTYTDIPYATTSTDGRQSLSPGNAGDRRSQTTLLSDTPSFTSSKRERTSLFATFKAVFEHPRSSSSRLFAAAKSGDAITLLKMIEGKAQNSRPDQNSINTALLTASSNEKYKGKQTEVIKLLLDQNAELECRDKRYGRTPLMWAINAGRLDIVEQLLDRQALINARDDEGWTPLALAYRENHDLVARVLIKHGANTNFRFKSGMPLLISAIMAGDEIFVDLLVSNRENKADVECKNKSGIPALSVAVIEERLSIVKLLIDNEAPLEAKDSEGRTALLWAVGRCCEDITELLVNNRANVNAVDNEGHTVQYWANLTNSDRIVELVSKQI